MKKTYIQPSTECYAIQSRQMVLSGSVNLQMGGNTEDNGITSGNAREYSFWDEED